MCLCLKVLYICCMKTTITNNMKIKDKKNYNNFLKILNDLNLDCSDCWEKRYEYGKNYEQHENIVVKVDENDFKDII